MVEFKTRFRKNPYDENFQINAKSKQISLKSNNSPLLLDKNGEIEMTHVVTYREVDEEEFLKLFTKNLSLIFNLSSAGNKALIVVCFVIQKYAVNEDVISLGRYIFREFIEEYGSRLYVDFTEPTFQRGVKDLIEKNVLAKTITPGRYFINYNVVFNGNRFTLTDIIQKKNKTHTKRVSDQIKAKEDKKQDKTLVIEDIDFSKKET